LLKCSKSPKYRIAEAPRPVLLGEQEFYRAKLTGQVPDFSIEQFFYTRIIRGFAFRVVVSAGNDDQLSRADAVLRGIHFDSSE
jgi:hypothetical protein